MTSPDGDAARYEALYRRLDAVTDSALMLLSVDEMFEEILGRMRTVMGAASATVLLLDEAQGVLLPRTSSELAAERDAAIAIPIGRGVAGRVAESGKSEIVPDLRAEPASVNPTSDGRLRSLAVTPLVSGGAVIGVLLVGAEEPNGFGDADLQLAKVVADRLTAALERTMLFEREHMQRVRAERALARTRTLQGIAEQLGSARTEEEVHQALLAAAADSVGAVAGVVALQDGQSLRIVAALGYAKDPLTGWESFPVETAIPLAEAFRTGSPVWGRSRAELLARYPIVADDPTQNPNEAFVAVPMLAGTSAAGALALRFREVRAFDEDELELIVAIARQSAIALERAHLLRTEDEASARARRLLESNVIGSIVEGPDDGILEANDAFLEMVGYSRQELEAGKLRWRAMTPAEQQHLSDAAFEELLATGRAAPFEKDYIHKDGYRVPVLLGLALLQSQPLRAIGFVLDLSERRAAEQERERLLELERRARTAAEHARERAESATARLQVLSEAGPKLSSSLDVGEIAAQLAGVAVAGLADYAIVWLLGTDGRVQRTTAAHRDSTLRDMVERMAASGRPDVNDDGNLVAQALRSGRTIVASSIDATITDQVASEPEQRRIMDRLGHRSAMFVPLTHRGKAIGVLGLVRSDRAAVFDDADRDLAEQLAGRAAQALENARLYAERAIVADTLQRSLLPPTLPDVRGVELSARYRPSGDGTQVGGDFYDVFPIGNDDWGIALGDVCGKGAPAAAVMALSRYTIRTAALSETRPSAILATLNEALLRHEADDRFCTAVFARLHSTAAGQRLTVACGGHPLPLLVSADGSVSNLGKPGTLLGTFPDPELTDVFADLDPGDAVIFFTDGLTDERSAGREFGDERLGEIVLGAAGRTADEIADRLLDAVLGFRAGEPRDDIAILVVRVEP
ncbi:MAG TPA: GAF domain-containing protein [Actinomycetota bacterium]|nr:GAF domain-containing protein [Actinomycetota bacterium]